MKKVLAVLTTKEVLGGQKFKLYGDVENPLFLARDVAQMIGHSKTSMMLEPIDEDEKLRETILTSGQNRDMWFLTEDGLYEVLLTSRKPIAKAFRKEVKGILKQLRKTGVVITEKATTEAIKFEDKFGKYRIRKTFLNSNNITEDYMQFIELSKVEWKSKRINNADRVKLSNLICKGLEQRLEVNKDKLRASEMLGIQELITDIKTDIIKLENKKNGGLKTGQTKQIKVLSDRLEEIETKYVIRDEEFITLDVHGFSQNCMYSYANGRTVKTNAYNNWIKYFPTYQVPTIEEFDVDFSKPVELFINYTVKKDIDIANLDKSFIVILFNRILEIDDNIVKAVHRQAIATVDNYQDGKIAFFIRNIESEVI